MSTPAARPRAAPWRVSSARRRYPPALGRPSCIRTYHGVCVCTNRVYPVPRIDQPPARRARIAAAVPATALSSRVRGVCARRLSHARDARAGRAQSARVARVRRGLYPCSTHHALIDAGWDHPAHRASISTPVASARPALERSCPSTIAR
eukprot:2488331-Pleurochrysis_carterae.AAC.1